LMRLNSPAVKSLSKNQEGDLRSAVSAGSETRAEPSSWIGSKSALEEPTLVA
jgi:hypothetical protein